MTTIALKSFSGEIPNLPTYLLPDSNAQQALFCDFAQKDLRPLHTGLEVFTMSNNIKGVYTEDGLTFFTWPVETYAFKSPVIGEQYRRVYFMNANGFKVTTYDQAQLTGGEPASSWNVGVPTPGTAPTLAVVDRTTLRGYGNATFTAKAWYEISGKRYDETTVTLTTVTAFKEYSFTPPSRSTYTPSDGVNPATGTSPDAVLCCQLTLTADTKEIFSNSIVSGSSGASRTTALPGTVEMTLTSGGVIKLNWGVYETRAYTYTVSNTWNEESAPAPAATIDVTYMQDVTVTVATPSFTGYRPYNQTRVYRTFGTSASYVSVGTTTTTTFSDTTYKASDIGATLISLDWNPPPSGMFGLTVLPNGVFAAFKDNVLYFSEPYRPHTWQYSITFPLNVRGICAGAQALVVTTAEGCYIVTGNTPKTMQPTRLPTPQPGVTHRSMALIEGGVVFASNDGMVAVQGSQATMNLSQQFFSREDWRGRYGDVLSDMRFAYHDGFLVATSSTQAKGFIVRLDEATGTFAQWNKQCDCAYYLPVQDTLYYGVGTKLYRFRGGNAYETLDWWSKDYILGKPVNFGAGFIRSTGSVTITLYADDVQWHQVTINGTGYFRIPAGKKALKWSIRFQTQAVVQEWALAESMSEFRSV